MVKCVISTIFSKQSLEPKLKGIIHCLIDLLIEQQANDTVDTLLRHQLLRRCPPDDPIDMLLHSRKIHIAFIQHAWKCFLYLIKLVELHEQ